MMSNLAFTIYAIDNQTDDGSVVHSGIKFADTLLEALNLHDQIEASLVGLKGASSSYFNVFLRRIDEGCGIDVFQHGVTITFDSKVQQMMYERSFESMKRGVHQSSSKRQEAEIPQPKLNEKTSVFQSLMRFFGIN